MNSSEEPTALDQLRKAVIQQKMAALSEESEDSIFHSLHIIVGDYDRFVSQMVIGMLTQGEKAVYYSQRTLVQTAVEEVETIADASQQRKVEQYRNYINRLDQMLQLALQVSSGSSAAE
jgi:uncharacterized protein YutE (UPF0331/DUF86 family)